ncbi:hypothetical protein LEP1GSC188_4418 [Leptospira weilii serovar Topaz str. LT2116]|uniref:Uncharacterized protein n=1 Tax=Leptospira weilii serovar Topaz str. LT2116 TaxID=1088540 RepID=M3H4R6_9LEPT|nr:hypothetical protein LEP1GSC188_4418 [Leptospira weilii serovar Topaz str. LT2116]
MENGWTIISSQFSLEGIGFRFFECVHNRRSVSYRSSQNSNFYLRKNSK